MAEDRKSARELNDEIRYIMYAGFRVRPGVLGEDRAAVAVEVEDVLEQYAAKGVVT
ncbi:MAG: hypothetical protein QOK14_656, partial [Frankiaceae bacterium]|nr:hypothetical protein [Frankiaceae bacterium]